MTNAIEHAFTSGVLDYPTDKLTLVFGPVTAGTITISVQANGSVPPPPQSTTTSSAVKAVVARPLLQPQPPGSSQSGPNTPPAPPYANQDYSGLDFTFVLTTPTGNVTLTSTESGAVYVVPPPKPTNPMQGASVRPPPPLWAVTVQMARQLFTVANVRLTVDYPGDRPMISKAIDFTTLNRWIDLAFNSSPPPLTIKVDRKQLPGSSDYQTVVTPVWSAPWAALHPPITPLALGVDLVTTSFTIEQIGLRATVLDGMPALRLDVGFPSFVLSLHTRGVVEALLSKAWGAIGWTGAAIAAAVAGVSLAVPGGEAVVGGSAFDAAIGALVTWVSADDIPIRDAQLTVYLVLRTSFDGTSLAAEPPTFDVIVQPYFGMDPNVGVAGRAIVGAAFGALQQFASTINSGLEYFAGLAGEDTIQKVRDQLHTYASALVGYLFGDPTKDVQPQPPQLTVTVAGDHPSYLETSADNPPTPIAGGAGNLSKIKNIVVLMMENRSFDHMVGYLSLPPPAGRGRKDVDGLTGAESNPDVDGHPVAAFPITNPYFAYDPNHHFDAVMQQRGDRYQAPLDPPLGVPPPPLGVTLDPPKFHVPLNGGFVIDFDGKVRKDPRVGPAGAMTTAKEVMGYHLAADVPMYDFFSSQFGLCNYWFAAHPGPTWPNRFVTLTGGLAPQPPSTAVPPPKFPVPGRPQADVPDMATFVPIHVPTIFDYLTRAGVSWRYFEHDLCMLRLFAKYTWDDQNITQIDDAQNGFFALAAKGELPSVVFIDPDLGDLPPGNDDHPPSSVYPGQQLIKRIYDALAASPQWKDVLFIVTYDENGGIFDHVFPPDDLRPGLALLNFDDVEPDFVSAAVTYRGFRVPAFVVSPYIPAGTVLPKMPYPGPDKVYDHTSILKTIVQRFMPNAPPPLGPRVDAALSLESWLTLDQPRPAPVSPGAPGVTAQELAAPLPPYDRADNRAIVSALRYKFWPR